MKPATSYVRIQTKMWQLSSYKALQMGLEFGTSMVTTNLNQQQGTWQAHYPTQLS